MKKFLAVMILGAVSALAAETNYWPNATNMVPQQIGKTYGNNAYVVGATSVASLGSIAIASDVGVAVVKDAAGAVQIGNGTNTVANSVKVGSTQVYPDARGVVVTNFTFLVSTGVTGKLWVANGVITNVAVTGQ